MFRSTDGTAPIAPDLAEIIRQVRFVVFDFDGVFTNNTVFVLEDGREAVQCSRFDGFGLRRIEALGVEPLILSTEQNPVVSARARKLRIQARQGVDDKLPALRREVEARGLTMAETAFVGNDINDLKCLMAVGLPVVVADAHPDVMAAGRYRTNHPGGRGAVREVCDLIHAVRTSESAA